MTILIFHGPRNGPTPYAEWLHDTKEELVLFTSTDAELPPGEFAEVRRFPNYEKNGRVELEAIALHRTRPLRAIIATAEIDLLRAGRVRSHLGLCGQSYESALAFRNKLVMRAHLQARGIRVPVFRSLDDSLTLHEFVCEHGFPVVVKPVDGSGSTDTHILRNDVDVLALVERGIGPGMQVETYVKGDMFHVDGVVLGGQTRVVRSSRYINGGLAFQEALAVGSYTLAEDDPLAVRLARFIERVLKVLPSPEHYTFHGEVLVTPDEQLVFCDVTSRTGGGRINESIRRAAGVDIGRAWIEAQAGLPIDAALLPPRTARTATTVAPGFALIPPRRGVLRRFPTTERLEIDIPSPADQHARHLEIRPSEVASYP